MTDRQKFAVLRRCRRVWAVSSIHGECGRLQTLHHALLQKLQAGDRLVYLGNLIGPGQSSIETLDELLSFRRSFLAGARAFACDLVFLRGAQEEMWQKLLQLQFASDPRNVLEWMLDQGLGTTLEAYGGDVKEARRAAGAGAVILTRWTGGLRRSIQAHPGHWELQGSLRRAAYSEGRDGLLFVHAGLNPAVPLEEQRDNFWWSAKGFQRIAAPYQGFARVVRGYEASHPGLVLSDHTATIDAGCGFGGPLLAACFSLEGELLDRLEA